MGLRVFLCEPLVLQMGCLQVLVEGGLWASSQSPPKKTCRQPLSHQKFSGSPLVIPTLTIGHLPGCQAGPSLSGPCTLAPLQED